MGLLFSRLTLTQKFLAFLLFASVIPLLVVGVTSYTISTNVLREESARYAAELVTAQKDYLERHLEEMSGLIENLAESEAIRAALEYKTPAESPVVRYAAQANITRQLSAYPGLQGLVSIDLFTLDGVHYHVGETGNAVKIRPEVKNKLYAQALNSRSGVTWAGIEDNVNLVSAYSKVITTARILTRADAGVSGRKPAALLLINCDPEAIHRHFSQFDLGEGAYLMVLDAENRIVYHPDKSLLGVQAGADIGDHLADMQGKFVDTVNGQEMLATYEKSIASRWTVISFIPLKALHASTVGIQRAALLTLALAFLLVFFSAAMVSRSVVAPIREITQRLKRFQEGTLDLRQRLEIKRRDEIGELLRWFNTFLDSLVARQQAEEALRQSEERYSLALRGANDGIWDWDLENNRLYYSARWKSMLGFGEDQLNESPEEWFSRVHPEDITGLMEDIHNHLNGTTAHFQNEHRLLAADGKTYCWVLARGLAVRDESGRALRMAGSLSDVTTRKAYEDQLRHDAMYDGLTKLPNRAYFIEQVRHAIEYTRRRRGYSAAVLCLDLDRFKIVNDSLGHASGDELLVVVARRLQQCLRAGDTVARLGGDEFAVLLDDLEQRLRRHPDRRPHAGKSFPAHPAGSA